MIKVNGFQPLTIIAERTILDVTAVLDPPRLNVCQMLWLYFFLIYVPKPYILTTQIGSISFLIVSNSYSDSQVNIDLLYLI